MIKLQDVYYSSPVFLQNLACSFEGWRINRRRYSDAFFQQLKIAESRFSWSEEQILAYRDQRLSKYMEHCADTMPFYRKCFAENGIDARDIRTLSDLQKLPILDRQVVKENADQFLSEAIPKEHLVAYATSGTSGNRLQFYTTHAALDEYWAVVWRFRRLHGIQMDTWSGYFSGATDAKVVVKLSQKKRPFWRYNYPAKQIRFSGFHMTEENLDDYLDELERKQITYLQGYPSWLSLLAAHMIESGKTLPQIKWVVTNSESLLEHQVELMERAFGVTPIQRYGMAEAIAGISQCLYGNFHVDEDLAAVEFVPNPEGFGHKVIGTSFTNPAFGFIRYDIQDIVTLSDDVCPCGRWGRLVKEIDGRKEDYIVLRNGKPVSRLSRIFKGSDHIREAQIWQKEDGFIHLRVVRGKGYNNQDEQTILHAANEVFTDEADYRIDYVEGIERSKSGKLRLVICDVER